MPSWAFLLILIREYTMNFIRMIATSKGTAIAARKGGKLKTVFYITSGLFAVLIESLLRLNVDIASALEIVKIVLNVMFIICVVLSYISFFDYIIHFAKILKSPETK